MSMLLFDIGGTNLRMAVGETSHEGAITNVQKIPTLQNPADAIAVLGAFARENISHLEGVSGCIAGLIEGGTVHVSPHLPEWNGFNAAEALHKVLAAPVSIANDAEAAGMGEATYGVGKDHKLVAYIGIGTGVGGALIVDRKVAQHAHGFEPGRQILDIENGATFEELVSGSALQKRFRKHPRDLPSDVYKELIPTLAAGLHNVILEWSPDVLVVGGSLMNEENGYRIGDIQDALKAMPSLLGMLPVVARSTLGDANGLYGALALASTN